MINIWEHSQHCEQAHRHAGLHWLSEQRWQEKCARTLRSLCEPHAHKTPSAHVMIITIIIIIITTILVVIVIICICNAHNNAPISFAPAQTRAPICCTWRRRRRRKTTHAQHCTRVLLFNFPAPAFSLCCWWCWWWRCLRPRPRCASLRPRCCCNTSARVCE